MERRLGRLFFVEDFLIEFLAVAQAGVADFNALGPGKFDHPFRQVRDLDRFAHVEDEDFSAIPLGPGLQHKFTGLRDQHEVPDDVRVGDRHGAAGKDLGLENRDDGAVGSQHVAEPGRDELGMPFDFPLGFGLIEALHVDFADPFGAAHDVRGVDGLVRGDHYELPYAVFHGQVGHDPGAEDVVPYALSGVVLHHRNMFVGGGVEDIFGPEIAEYPFHMLPVRDRTDDDLRPDARVLFRQQEPQVVLRGFGLVDQYEFCRGELTDLADDFAADAAGGAGDQHLLAAEAFFDRLQVDRNLLAGKEVLDAHLFEAGGGVLAGAPFFGLVDHVNLRTGVDEVVLELLVFAEDVVALGRDEDGLDVELPDDLGQVLVDGIDLFAEEAGVSQFRIMRDESLEVEAGGFFVPDILGQADAAVHDAVDQYVFGVFSPEGNVVNHFDQDPHGPHHKDGNPDDDDDFPGGKVDEESFRHPRDGDVDHQDDGAGREHGQPDTLQVDEGGVADDPGVCMIDRKEDDADADVQDHRAGDRKNIPN